MSQPDGINYVATRLDEQGSQLWIYVQTIWIVTGQVVSRFCWMAFPEYMAQDVA